MDSLREASSAYYGNERFSDFTINCGDKKYKVHRCFISAHSKYFERACLSSFAEAEKQSIDLKEDLPEAVDCMIQYFYMFDYNDSIGLDYDGSAASDGDKQPDQTANLAQHHPQFSMQLNAWVYAVAEKYEAPGLKALALKKFKKGALTISESHARTLCTAHTVYKLLPLPASDRVLHEFLVDSWVMHAYRNFSNLNANDLASAFEDLPRFAADVNLKFMEGFKQNGMWVLCPRCKKRSDIPQLPQNNTTTCTHCRNNAVPPKEDEAVLLSKVTIKKFW